MNSLWLATSNGLPAAWIAASAAVLAAVFTGVMSWRQGKSTREHERDLTAMSQDFAARQREVDFRVRQLSELYWPLKLLRQASKTIRTTFLPAADAMGGEWRLVDNIAEVKTQGGHQVEAVEEILELNAEIERLLLDRAGLVELKDEQGVFYTFIAHSRLLALSWRHGNDQSPDARIPFPLTLDQEIERGFDAVTKALEAARETPPPDELESRIRPSAPRDPLSSVSSDFLT